MWFLDKRIQVICDELKKLITVKNMPMEHILYKEGRFFYPDEAEKAEQAWQDFTPKTMKCTDRINITGSAQIIPCRKN